MRFCDVVGYGESTETPPGSGVWEDVITEVEYRGDVIRNSRRMESEGDVLSDITVNNSISIVADDQANRHFYKIKYVRWEGVLWTVTTVEVKAPRLILSLGKVYNGPTP
jgi:hypothetical protein